MRRLATLGLCVVGCALVAIPARAQAPNDRVGGETSMANPLKNMPEVQILGKMLFKLFDENSDNKISQREATDAGNLFVGGFFFSADTNGDGAVSEAEMKQAREAFLSARPWVKYAVETAEATQARQGNASNTPESQAKAMFAMLDANHDRQLQATELRQGVQIGVQALFATVDTNRDGQLTMSEVDAGLEGLGRIVADVLFQQADTDKNGQISQAEFDKAIIEPARVAFAIADLNHDGQISQQELQTARQVLMSQLQLPSMSDSSSSTRGTTYSTPSTTVQPAPGAAPVPR